MKDFMSETLTPQPVITRVVQAEALLAKKRLQSCPWLLPETVARHYASLASAAVHLQKLTNLRRENGGNDELLAVEVYLLQAIWDEHCHAFGSPPAWPVSVSDYESVASEFLQKEIRVPEVKEPR